MRKIIMVCTGNTCRSPMAEALMKAALLERGIKDIEVESAGTAARPGYPASFEAVIEMRLRGLDIQRHRSEQLCQRDISGALLLCMTQGHATEARRMFPDAQVDTLMRHAGLSGDIKDPIGMGEAAYKATADMMKTAIDAIADGIIDSKGR